MRKEFIEYQGDIRKAPNNMKDIVEYLTELLMNYERKIRSESLEEIEIQRIIVVLKDALWSALTVIDGKCNLESSCNGDLNINYLITLLFTSFSRYSFGKEQKKSDTFQLSNKDTAELLIDFLNCVALWNDYDRKFDLKDFVTKYQELCREDELNKLKNFSLKVDQYCLEIMNNGANADELIKKVFLENGVYRISKSGTVYYSREYRVENKISNTAIFGEEANKILTEVDAIICAYYKCLYDTGYNYRHGIENNQIAKNKLIYHRIKRMKTRGEKRY